MRKGSSREVDSHVTDHGHVSFRGHSWCRFLEYSRNIYDAQVLLIRPAYLYLENVIGEGLLVAATVGLS